MYYLTSNSQLTTAHNRKQEGGRKHNRKWEGGSRDPVLIAAKHGERTVYENVGYSILPVAPIETAHAVLVCDPRNTLYVAPRVGEPASQQPEGDHGRELGGHPGRGVDD